MLVLLAPLPARAFTSSYAYVNLAGNFNGFQTGVSNMLLVADGQWQATVTLTNYVRPQFLFATAGFINKWAETDQTWFGPWLKGVAEKNTGVDVVISNTITGTLLFKLDEVSGAYSVEMIETNAIAWTSRYAYVNLAGSFNGFDTYSTNMILVSNGVWQSYATLNSVTNPAFIFATRDFAETWKESNQTVFTLPAGGQVEFNTGSDISIVGVVSGTLRFQFDEKNGSYLVEDVTPPFQPGDLWINEIHYDHVGTDTNEYIEVAGPAGTALGSYSLALYNGNDNAIYSTLNLSGTIPNQLNGYGTVLFLPGGSDRIQNGPPDGIALVKDATNLIEFLSYEGTMVGGAGAASGVLSDDIGVQELNSTPVDHSLQRVGTGSAANAFAWVGPLAGSPGAVNAGQSMPVGTPPASVMATNLVHLPSSPQTNEPVYIEADVSTLTGASNLTVTAFYRVNSNDLFRALSMSRTGDHVRTFSPVPGQPAGSVVEYYIFATFAGLGTNSPSWFPANAPAQVQSYGISSVQGGQVWINEIDPEGNLFEWPAPDNLWEYIELAGLAGSDISDWQVRLWNSQTNLYATYVLPPGSQLPNDNAGFGFFVLGTTNVPNTDLVMTNLYASEYIQNIGGIQLINEFGIVQQALWYGVESDLAPPGFYDTDFEDDLFGDLSLALTGTGGNFASFTWSVNGVLQPGMTNQGQVFTGGNTNPLAPTIVCPDDVFFSCLGAPVPTVNVASVTATGLCGNFSVTVTHAGDVTNSGTGCSGNPKIITRSYRAVSDCGTTSLCSQLIIYEDTAGPVLALLGGTQELVNASFESGTLQGWTPFGELSNEVSVTVLNPFRGFAHGRIIDPAPLYAADATGNGADGRIYGGPRRGVAATNGTAFVFDGVDDRIDIPYTPEINGTTFSFSVWARWDGDTSAVHRSVLSARGASSARGFTLFQGTNNWILQTGNGSTVSNLTGSAVVSGRWTHVVGTIGGSNRVLYVNGTSVSGVFAYAVNTVGVTRVGAGAPETAAGQFYFRGAVDDLQFFRRVLTLAEVTNLYNAGKGNIVGTNIQAHLKLDEAAYPTGTVAGVYQALPASSGQTWSASGYLMHPAGSPLQSSNQAAVELQFLNAASGQVWAVTSTPVRANTPSNTYIRYSVSGVASAGVAAVRAVVRYSHNSDVAGQIYFDAFTLSRFALDPGTNCSVTLGDLRPNFAVSDNCSVVSTNQSPPAGTPLGVGDHLVTISALDQCGQMGSSTIQVTVVDVKAPVIIVSNITVACEDQISLTNGITVVDCSTNVTFFLLSETITGGNGCPGNAITNTRILQATDDAGFTTYATQRITQVSTSAPVVNVSQTGSLANAGFETGTALTNWTRIGNVFSSPTLARSGAQSMRLTGFFSGPQSAAIAYQDHRALGGQHWRASGWALTPTNNPIAGTNSLVIKLEFMDVNYQFLQVIQSRLFGTGDAMGSYQPMSAQGYAPENTAWVRVTVLYTQYGTTPGAVHVDDMALNMTSLTSSNGLIALPDLRKLVVSSNLCSTPVIVQVPTPGTVVTAGVTNVSFRVTDQCARTRTGTVAVVIADEVVASSVPPMPTNVVVTSISLLSTNLVIRSQGTNTWSVVPEYATNLVSPVWLPISNGLNSFVSGTNITSFAYPVTNAGQSVIIRIRQTYP